MQWMQTRLKKTFNFAEWRDRPGGEGHRKAERACYSVNAVRSPLYYEGKPVRAHGLLATIRDFFYGLSSWEFERQAVEMRGALESLFMAITVGDMLGLPVIPPIYALRILPYVVPNIATWKRRVCREREFSDSEEFHLHGV